MEIFRVVVRGDASIRGVNIDPSPDLTMPGVSFRQETSPVAIVLREESGKVNATPAIRHRGEWANISLTTNDDHILIGSEWCPLDAESLDAVRTWLNREDTTDSLGAAAYIE